ncbi:MAG: 4Fe-4S binding protein [Desulfobacterales bacterium]|jgi:Na+-translocating ferredoxin:NAD+ oxidoreductase subunit B|nr:4Fe-4S binding protein [Desulfobacteraceae bacterium]MBT7086458.1 4Fe-4S binding protein [Desulfobacterales bacterium]MBT7696131.1 4Fe-4S binding protein [Desulfobacterales bacterium]
MEKDIYEKLYDHFNEVPASRLRNTKELRDILHLLFSAEQAEYAVALPITHQGRLTVEELAKKMGRDVKNVRKNLEVMAKEGYLLVTTSRKDGKTYYALWPLMPGILESVYADGNLTDQRRRLTKLVRKYYSNGLWNELASSKYSQMRIIPINQQVNPESEVFSFEEVQRIIEAADIITVIPCMCRQCESKCDHIIEADFVFNAWANHLINYRGARLWTKDEALLRMEECEKDGLVHLGANSQSGNIQICNCCPCCCFALRGLTELHNANSFVRSNFEPSIDHKKCNLCKKCEKICPMDCISKLPGYEANGSDNRMLIQESHCIGCGLCASHCPENAIVMNKVRQDLPAKTIPEMMERYEKEKLW